MSFISSFSKYKSKQKSQRGGTDILLAGLKPRNLLKLTQRGDG